MQAQAYTYKEIRTFEYANMVVRVHIPDLTDEERKRNMKQLMKATESLLKSYKKKDNKLPN